MAQQPFNFRIESPRGPIIGRNAEHYDATTNADGSYDFSGTGKPVIIERPADGVTLSGNQVTGRLRQLPDHNFVVEKGSFVDDAKMVSDTKAADAYLAANNKPLPKRHATERMEIDSQRFDYAGTETEGTLTSPVAIQLEGHSSGSREVTRKVKGKDLKGPEDFDQTTHIDASKGSITIDPQPTTPDKQRLKKGDLTGPVKLHLVRSVKGPGDPVAVINIIDGAADHASFDFTGAERTITATGHVVVTDDNGPYKNTYNADTVVLTVDENLRVTKIHSEGSPGTTSIHPKGGGR